MTNSSDSSVERGKEALESVGASEQLLEGTPEGVLELVGRAETEPQRLDRARSLLRTRRNRQQRITLRDRWSRLHGTPDGELEDPFEDRT